MLHVSCVMFHVSCVMCHVSCVMLNVSCVMCRVRWVMRTMVGEREVTGTASRLHFYPADSDREEDSQVGGRISI